MSTAITRAGGGFAISPANMGELFQFAKLLAESDLVPKDYRDKPGNCVVAIQMGGELGLSPMQSIQNIAVINGRPSLWGDALLAVCLPHLDAFEETDDGNTATCRAVRGKRSVTTTFSMEDAKRAGLAGKQGPWTQYPARMRKMRARSFTLRDLCADILRGVHSAEEAADLPKEVRAEVTSSKPADEPQRLPPPAAAKKPLNDHGYVDPLQPVKGNSGPDVDERPKFSVAFPNTSWNGLAMENANHSVLEEYMDWCRSIENDSGKKKGVRENAAKSRAAAEEVFERLMQREGSQTTAESPSDPIAEARRAGRADTDPVADALEKDVERTRPAEEDLGELPY